ncbi:phospholipase A [Acinetobacter sp. MD2(2019)]|uniref:phospholipase A n=1 Tax=Acinetobacter sp. MD2(2019) TaxID=2605273 RepID=UPI002D1EAD0B|nr:phospholipase A [Acinetobacter sp. MD2(2019)]MEB3754206.1 phospholipase A [Acinetobacter sp. MD2(2019)]
MPFKTFEHTAMMRAMLPLLGSLLSSAVFAEDAATFHPVSATACSGILSDADRLVCYDSYFKAQQDSLVDSKTETAEPKTYAAPLQAAAEKPVATEDDDSLKAKLARSLHFIYSADASPMSANQSLLDSRWELSPQSKLGTWNIRAYKPVYALPVFWTSNRNELPHSANPVNTVTERQNLNFTESKFQLSLKTKAWENIFGDNGDLWLAYTQSSRWQVYNSEDSRPFRETNYEPEASLIFRTNYNLLGLDGRLLGLSFNHQSNGKADPFSRSWNRVMLNWGLERGNFALMIRPWYRIPEDAVDDNNPDIENYMGRADLTAFYKWNDHNFSLMLRHSLRSGDNSHGAMQFDWTFPIKGKLRGELQYFNGYGESLIDYNHRASYIGVGVSLMDWF